MEHVRGSELDSGLMGRRIEDGLRQVPDEHLDHKTRRRLVELAAELDQVAFVDGRTDQVYLDEKRVQAILRKYGPKGKTGFVDRFVAEAKSMAAGQLRPARKGDRTLTVAEARDRLGIPAPPPDELAQWGLRPDSSEGEAVAAIRHMRPDFPEGLLQPGALGKATKRLMEQYSGGPAEDAARGIDVASFWRCLGHQWLAIGAFFAAIGVIIGPWFSVVILGGPWAVGLLWGALIGLGVGVTVTVIGCLLANMVE